MVFIEYKTKLVLIYEFLINFKANYSQNFLIKPGDCKRVDAGTRLGFRRAIF